MSVIKDPVVTVDILKEDVLLRHLASFKSREMDHLFMKALRALSWYEDNVPEGISQPTVLCTSPIPPSLWRIGHGRAS